MIDIQSQRDHRRVEINKSGGEERRVPHHRPGPRRTGSAHRGKGQQCTSTCPTTSREPNEPLREILNEYRGTINIKAISTILDNMKEKLNAESAYLEVEFPYFIEKTGPRFGAKSLMGYTCQFFASLTNGRHNLIVGITVPVTTVCPCSGRSARKGPTTSEAWYRSR